MVFRRDHFCVYQQIDGVGCRNIVLSVSSQYVICIHTCIVTDLKSLRCWAHFLTARKRSKESVTDSSVDIPFILWDKPVSLRSSLG